MLKSLNFISRPNLSNSRPNEIIEGILPQKIFYQPNFIFWIVMGCGKARFSQKGQKPLEVENFVLWDLMCGAPGGPREQTLRQKCSILGGFLALPTKTSFTTPSYYPKYEV